jgi:hypothetical protein
MYQAAFLNKIISSSLKLLNNLRDAMDMSVCSCDCGLFKFTVSYSDYVASSDRLKTINRAGCGGSLSWRSLSSQPRIFLERLKKKPRNASVRIVFVQNEVRTRNIPNTRQKPYQLSQRSRSAGVILKYYKLCTDVH